MLDGKIEIGMRFHLFRHGQIIVRTDMEETKIPCPVYNLLIPLHTYLFPQQIHQLGMYLDALVILLFIIYRSVSRMIRDVVRISLTRTNDQSIHFRKTLEQLLQHRPVYLPCLGLLERNLSFFVAYLVFIKIYQFLRQHNDIRKVESLQTIPVTFINLSPDFLRQHFYPSPLFRTFRKDTLVELRKTDGTLRKLKLIDNHAIHPERSQLLRIAKSGLRHGISRIMMYHIHYQIIFFL